VKKLILAISLLFGLLASAGATTLNNGVAVSALSALSGNTLSFDLAIPSGASNLTITIAGGSGDADLYVRYGALPTSSTYDCRPYLNGNDESCTFAAPSTGTYYIDIRAYSAFSGLSLVASYDLASGGSSGSELSNGVPVTALAGASGSQLDYTIAVPTGASNLVVAISGGSGDADLYVRYGALPTSSTYDCRPYLSGNSESCSFTAPQVGTYYIRLVGYSAFSGVTLSASYQSGGSSGGGGSGGSANFAEFETYYANAIGKSGSALLSALNEAASRNQVRMSYSAVWEALKYTDEDPNNSNNVILLYTGRSQAKSYNSGSYSSDPDAWNREHSWPKSHGFPDSGDWAYTDIHHLRPADASVNSSRGNKDFDEGGSQISEAPGNYTDSDSFEPRAAVKGDIARMMFYMAVRYNGGDGTGTEDLQLVNYTGTSGASLGKLCTLLQWHQQDPVSSEEIARHARIVERQGNRNPFVDYPAWADQIWGASCGS